MRHYLPILILLCLVVARIWLFFSSGDYLKKGDDGYLFPVVETINSRIEKRTQQSLPTIHADLLLGMTIGLDTIKNNKTFYDRLVQLGLVHVVVVSGYNVALVMKFISSLFTDRVQGKSKLVLLSSVVVYVLICGAQPPVIRAGLMGYISYLCMTEGRGVGGLPLLIVTCTLMLLIYPKYIISLSFWLSVSATLGLMFFEPMTTGLIDKLVKNESLKKLLPFEDLSTSLACTVIVWPIISYFFGRISLASPLYNMILLWLIPICTVAGFIYIAVSQLLPPFADLIGVLIFPFFDMFVRGVNALASIDKGNVDFQLTLTGFIVYYVIAAGVLWHTRFR